MITKTLTISPQTTLKLHGLLIHKPICYILITLGKEEIKCCKKKNVKLFLYFLVLKSLAQSQYYRK